MPKENQRGEKGMTNKSKTTMSVREMRNLLGLKKTESYYLVHRGFFETILVEGKMRVDIASFEKWYANQIKLKKVDGPPPGEELNSYSYSIRDIAKLLGITESVCYELIKKNQIETFTVDSWMRVRKDVFEEWYKNQTRYRTTEDRERDRALEEATYTMPEIARILLLTRREVYDKVIYNPANKGKFDFVMIGDRKRITKKSFEKWYRNQRKYRKLCDLSEEERINYMQKQQEIEREMHEKQKKMAPKRLIVKANKQIYTAQEVAILMDISYRDVLKLIADGELEAKKYGTKYMIRREEITWRLLQSKLYEENL